jgi:four helix bundle protein
MRRNHRKLDYFRLADELVVAVYRHTGAFPEQERDGLRVQLRRAAVAAASKIVEGCARRSSKGFHHYLRAAAGSASEAQYLVELAGRLGLMDATSARDLASSYAELVSMLRREEGR